jgi:hypothetical protein
VNIGPRPYLTDVSETLNDNLQFTVKNPSDADQSITIKSEKDGTYNRKVDANSKERFDLDVEDPQDYTYEGTSLNNIYETVRLKNSGKTNDNQKRWCSARDCITYTYF